MWPHNHQTHVGNLHPMDKVEPEEQGKLVYQTPRKNFGAAYIGEPGKQFKTRREKHQKKNAGTHQENNEREWKDMLSSYINVLILPFNQQLLQLTSLPIP